MPITKLNFILWQLSSVQHICHCDGTANTLHFNSSRLMRIATARVQKCPWLTAMLTSHMVTIFLPCGYFQKIFWFFFKPLIYVSYERQKKLFICPVYLHFSELTVMHIPVISMFFPHLHVRLGYLIICKYGLQSLLRRIYMAFTYPENHRGTLKYHKIMILILKYSYNCICFICP